MIIVVQCYIDRLQIEWYSGSDLCHVIDNTIGEERSGRMGDVMIMMLNNVSGPDSMNRSDNNNNNHIKSLVNIICSVKIC
jgi:hypothetical protein